MFSCGRQLDTVRLALFFNICRSIHNSQKVITTLHICKYCVSGPLSIQSGFGNEAITRDGNMAENQT